MDDINQHMLMLKTLFLEFFSSTYAIISIDALNMAGIDINLNTVSSP